MALHDLLASADPGARVADDHRGVRVAELAAEARGWARRLADAGGAPGDRIALLLPNGLALAGALLGALQAGMTAVPLHPGSPPALLAAVFRDCRPALLVTTESAPAPPSAPPTLRVAPQRPAAPATAVPQVPPAAHALIMYTSGSTGRPRGVTCPHPQAEFAVSAIAERLAYRADDTVYSCLPMSFDYGLYQLFLALRGGSGLVVADSAIGPGALAGARDAGATVVPVVPALARRLALLAGRPGAEPPPVRLFTNTGDALTPADCARLRRTFPHASVVRMFGLTECKRVTVGDPDDDLVAPRALGRPLPGTRIDVHGTDGRPLPRGSVGELVVHGPHVMAGYWQDPESTRARFRPDGDGTALHTGDHGWIDDEGRFCFSHRADDLCKIGAVRIGAGEIESAALRVDGIEAACAVRRAADAAPVVFAVGTLSRAAFARALARELGAHRTPTELVFLDELPVNRNGKTDRSRLRAMAADRAPRP